jgi:hypothetical protein
VLKVVADGDLLVDPATGLRNLDTLTISIDPVTGPFLLTNAQAHSLRDANLVPS